jgi:hypothetical protein
LPFVNKNDQMTYAIKCAPALLFAMLQWLDQRDSKGGCTRESIQYWRFGAYRADAAFADQRFPSGTGRALRQEHGESGMGVGGK